jgi:hypothetical protein
MELHLHSQNVFYMDNLTLTYLCPRYGYLADDSGQRGTQFLPRSLPQFGLNVPASLLMNDPRADRNVPAPTWSG